MPSTRSMDSLILHTAGDVLYFGTGRPQAAVFDRGPKEFVEQEWVRQAESVRVLGTADNAELIVELHNYRLRNGSPQIFLGSPSLCHLERDPPEVIRQLMEIEYPPSVGGWHLMTALDYPAYALIVERRAANYKFTKRVKMALKAHPAAPALAFIPSLSPQDATALLCEMIDPRFHIDPKNPDSVSRLKQRFGLGEPGGAFNAAAWLSGNETEATNRFEFATMVFNTWSSGWEGKVAQDAVSPRDFLMRVVKRVMEKKNQTSVAMLRASHVFMRFLRYTWLDSLTPQRKYQNRQRNLGKEKKLDVIRTLCKEKSYSPTLFVPDHFFVHEDEIEAWKAFKPKV